MLIKNKQEITIEIEDICRVITENLGYKVKPKDIERWKIVKSSGDEMLERIIITFK